MKLSQTNPPNFLLCDQLVWKQVLQHLDSVSKINISNRSNGKLRAEKKRLKLLEKSIQEYYLN